MNANPDPATASPFALPSIRAFILFRALFNARFYYPVFTIFFLDLGLTIEQFAILNVFWAASIVLLEIPSGALADLIGRRRLVVTAGALMVVEMVILSFAPADNIALLFGLLAVNRVLSGAAEAAASGADEALAYDTLVDHGLEAEWGRVLEAMMRFQSLAFFAAMALGAALYDATVINAALAFLGTGWELAPEVTLRFPAYLCLLTAVLTFLTALRLQEPRAHEAPPEAAAGPAETRPREDLQPGADHSEASAGESPSLTRRPGRKGEPGREPAGPGSGITVKAAFRQVMRAGLWIWRTPFALAVIVAGLLFDSVIRMFLTLNSEYYRQIGLPEGAFGLIGSGLALLGFFVPRLARYLAEERGAVTNFILVSGILLAGLVGFSLFVPYWGLFPVVFLYTAMVVGNYLVSHYLNRTAVSKQRATILSFRGLSYNLGYGLIGLLYSGLTYLIRQDLSGEYQGTALEDAVFRQAAGWFPAYFLVTVGIFALVAFFRRDRIRADGPATPRSG